MEIPEAMIETQARQQMANDFASESAVTGTDYGAVLPVHRNDSREDDGADATTGREEH